MDGHLLLCLRDLSDLNVIAAACLFASKDSKKDVLLEINFWKQWLRSCVTM